MATAPPGPPAAAGRQFDIPSWASNPPAGLHLDVMKGDRLVQKLLIDGKSCYTFGRNSQQNDFCTDHGSCSRVHAALVFHKILNKSFLYDLGSTHGTFIGNVRLETHKPTQLHTDSRFHFGASTREYIVREAPQQASGRPIMEELERATTSEQQQNSEGVLLGLPETDTELDNLTAFNTAKNRRPKLLLTATPETENDDMKKTSKKRKRSSSATVTFAEEEEIINPEDVDPSVGRFRNMVQTVTIPMSKKRRSSSFGSVPAPLPNHQAHSPTSRPAMNLYDDFTQTGVGGHKTMLPLPPPPPPSIATPYFTSLSTKYYGLPTSMIAPNPDPDVEPRIVKDEVDQADGNANQLQTSMFSLQSPIEQEPHPQVMLYYESPSPPFSDEPAKKKRYAKEAWPGRKQVGKGHGMDLLQTY